MTTAGTAAFRMEEDGLGEEGKEKVALYVPWLSF